MADWVPTLEDEENYLVSLKLSLGKAHLSDKGMSPDEIKAAIEAQEEKISQLKKEANEKANAS